MAPRPVVRSFVRAVVVAALACTTALAQLSTQAFYPLAVDLFDATSTYGPMTLAGTPPPAPPQNGVCVNGIYHFSPGGQDARTPDIGTLNSNDFQIDVEFLVAALPSSVGAPVLMAGNGWRWIGIYVQPSGIVGLKYNNSLFTWSATTLTTGLWYAATIKFENGNAELWLNGLVVHQAALGALTTGNNLNFTTNDYSTGRNHNGCLRNLRIANDTTLGAVAAATSFGTGCDGLSTGANGVPTLGNAAFEVVVANAPLVSPFVFVAFGSSAVYPGTDLTPIGMGGCASYTTFDLGLYGPAAVVGGQGNFPLPIPNSAALAGTTFAAQGVSFSTAIAFGLAVGNGTQLVLGL